MNTAEYMNQELTRLRAENARLRKGLEDVVQHLETVSVDLAPLGGAWNIARAALSADEEADDA